MNDNKLMKWLSDSFAPNMNKLFSKPWIAGVASSMQKIIPFILASSVIFLYNVILTYIPSLPDLWPMLQYSFMILTLITAYMVANQCMDKLNLPEYSSIAGLVSICVLFMVASPKGEAADSLSAFMNNLGPAGMIVGIIVGVFVSVIFNLWSKLHFLKESSLPDFLTNWINSIIPILLSLGASMVLVLKLNLDLYNIIMSFFAPLQEIGQSFPGFVLITFLPAFFYTMGISSWTLGAITTPIYLAGIQANMEAVAAGNSAVNIATSETVFTLAFITMGGFCATLGLNLLMCFSKSKELKILGRVFIVPSIFNINEPIMFGAPVVFNPVLMVPAWICALVGPIYTFVLMRTGLLNIPSILLNTGQIPAPFSSYLITADLRAFIWWAILFVIYMVIWYPFFKVFEKEKLTAEATQVTE